MKVNEINDFRTRIAGLLADGHLHEAFAALRSFSEGGMTWEITSAIDRLEANYASMLRYMVSGVDDPQRPLLYADIVAEARQISDILARRAMMGPGTSLYYGTARTLAAGPGAVATDIAALEAETRRLASDIASIADPRRTVNAEALATALFGRLWVTHPLSPADTAAVAKAVTSQSIPYPYRAMAVGALSLGAMEFFDPARLALLLEIFTATADSEPAIAVRASTGFFLAMFRYRRRPMPRRLGAALAAAKESPRWNDYLRHAAIELMRSRDTERISRRLSDDILPTLGKLAPEMRRKLSEGTPLDIESLAEGANPDWEDLLNRDGLGDKLREMSEIQAEGGDIYMSSFGPMKQFPFFHDVAAWFMPFTPEHSAVATADPEGAVSTAMERLPFLCDSDKYSVILALGAAPATARNAAVDAMSAQQKQMDEMLSEIERADDADTRLKNLTSNYVRDLYRFYNLFRRKGEFFNPFARGVDLTGVEALAEGFDDTDTLTLIAEFDIRHNFLEEAAALLTRIDRDADGPDAIRSQKIGYCLEKTGHYVEALSRYEEAEMLGGSGRWLLDRTARTLRRLGNPVRAAKTYQRILDDEPDDFDTIIALGNTYIEARRADRAEATFHRAVYLQPGNMSALRGRAWAQFMAGKFDASLASYAEIIAAGATAADYLNAGHTARALGNMREAVNYYRLSVDAGGGNTETLRHDLAQDNSWLVEAGVDTSQDALLVEAIMYSSENQ